MSGDSMDMRREDDRLIGELVAKVQILTTEVTTLRTEVTNLNSKMNTGRGMFYGVIFAAGGVGAGLSQLAEKLFK